MKLAILNQLVFFSLIILSSLRIIGLFISLELFFSLKKKRFISIVAGWIVWVIAGILPLIYDFLIIKYRILLVFNAIFAGEGLLLIFLGILAYFYSLPGRLIFGLSLSYIAIPLIIDNLLGGYTATFIAFLLNLVLYFIIFWIVLRIPNEVKNRIGLGIRYFYVAFLTIIVTIGFLLILMLTLDDYEFGLYYSTNSFAIMFNYSLGIFLTGIFIVLFVYIERGITSLEKFYLKDKYSHNIGNLLQAILSAALLTKSNHLTESEKKKNLELIQNKCEEASELLKEIRTL